MNWVGGARSRVRQQADRKKQKEFFERKRLQAKVKKVRPKSPQAGSSRVISKDLLYLQAISKIHDGRTDDLSEPLSRVKKMKLTGPRAVWPERNLALPMSPITKPSALDLHDTTCDTQLSSLLTTTRAPRVSTQKLPHPTVLNSFGPPPQQKRSGFDNGRQCINPSTDSTSLWTESVFSKGPPAPFGPSHMDETLGVEKKRFVVDRRPTAGAPSGDVFVPDRNLRQHIEFPDRDTRRRSLVAKKSYDHETPFNFGEYPLVKGNECSGKDLPRTNASSLLDFHMSENHSKPEYRFQAKGRDQPQKKEHKPCMWRMDEVEPGLPTGGTAEPGDKAMQWDSLHSHKEQPSTNVQSTSTSSMFDENPLSRKAAPPSCSTVFNESILGPIRRHNLGNNVLPRKSPPPVIPEPTVTKSGYSAFERMMSTFDAFEKTLAKSVQPQPDRVEGLVDQLTSTIEGADNIGRCVTMFGNESDKGAGDTGEAYTAQSKKWQDFINGYTQQPHQQDKQWQKFIDGELDDKPVINRDARVPDRGDDSQQNNVYKRNDTSIKIDRNTTGKLASISVMDELMCLEDIGSINGSDAVSASQEISFTPVVFSRQVPDIDTGFGAQRCMSENPLKLNHTLTKCSMFAESEATCKEESESVGMKQVVGMEQVVAICEAPVACENDDIVEQECADYGPHGNDFNCNELHNKLEEDVTCNIQSIDRQTKSECEQSCTKCGNKATAVAKNSSSDPFSNSHLKLSSSSQFEAANVDDVIASGDPIITEQQASLIPAELHDYVQQRADPPKEVLYRESIAVQCSMDESSPLRGKSEDKSTQTHSTAYADNSVQTADVVDQNISISENISLESKSTSSSQTVKETFSAVRQSTEDEQILTLRRELDSMRSTVIWQALMLRLYGMH